MSGRRSPLGEIAKVGAGNSAPQGDHLFSSDGLPFFRTSDVGRIRFGKIVESADRLNEEGSRGLRLLPKGTILFPKSGASTFLNHRVMLDVDGFVSSHLATIVADESRIRANYLLYFLATIEAQDLVQDHAYPSLNLPVIAGIQVPTPPLEEQHRIVALLDEAFAGIATAKANAEQCLQNVRDVDAVYRQTVFSGHGWTATTLDRIAKNLDSRRIPITKSDRKPGEYPYYGASGIVDYVADYIFDGDALLISEDGANLLARSTPIAFSVTGKYWVNNHAHILKFDDMATQKFVEFYLESIPLDDYITGAAQPKLNQKALNSIPVPMPSTVGERAEVVLRMETMQRETKHLQSLYARKLAALDALKQSLLQQAFSGAL